MKLTKTIRLYAYAVSFVDTRQPKPRAEQTETVIPVIENTGVWTDLFDRKIRSFLDAVKNGTASPVPTSQIIYNQAIIDGICRSAKAGHELAIEIPED